MLFSATLLAACDSLVDALSISASGFLAGIGIFLSPKTKTTLACFPIGHEMDYKTQYKYNTSKKGLEFPTFKHFHAEATYIGLELPLKHFYPHTHYDVFMQSIHKKS